MPDYDFWLRMMLKGSFIRIPESLSKWRVHEGSQAFSKIPFERADEPIRILEKFFSERDLPEHLLMLKSESLSAAALASAQLHARSNRYSIAFVKLILAASMSPRIIISPRTWHVIANSLFQQPAHRLLKRVRVWLGFLG